MYDASGVRRAVGKQAAILNKIVEDLQNKKHIEHETLKELVGHTPKEVIFGAILGIVVAVIWLKIEKSVLYDIILLLYKKL